MAKNPKAGAKAASGKTVEALRHRREEATRKNIPTAEYQPVLEKETQDPVRIAYERRNRDLDPQLVWRGKDEQDWSGLVVHAPPLYIQEKVHPKALIDDLLRQTKEREPDAPPQLDLAEINGIVNQCSLSRSPSSRSASSRSVTCRLLQRAAAARFALSRRSRTGR